MSEKEILKKGGTIMTQKEKQLLLKDLCAKSPFCLYVQGADCVAPFKVADIDFERECVIVKHKTNGIFDGIGTLGFEDIKPYFRPMSSMTEEEGKQYNTLLTTGQYFKLVDYLNEKKFDYRGLIPMGLALEAPEGMYNLKEK